ncbi:MAG: hypothetical protein J5898_05295 [Lachnospiraceae bacterium]|nr:hypothetical protein [Lachnospiraceae bacterium]
MNSLLSALCSYGLLLLIFTVAAVTAVFVGISLRKRKNIKEASGTADADAKTEGN